jgi:hypothetical protein
MRSVAKLLWSLILALSLLLGMTGRTNAGVVVVDDSHGHRCGRGL